MTSSVSSGNFNIVEECINTFGWQKGAGDVEETLVKKKVNERDQASVGGDTCVPTLTVRSTPA